MNRLLLGLCLIHTLFALGQEVDVEILEGKFQEDSIINTSLLFSESDGKGGLIVVRNTETVLSYNPCPSEYYIEHYDANLELVEKVTLTNDQKYHLKGLIVEGGMISLIRFDYDKESLKVDVNLVESEVDDLKFEKHLIKSFDLDYFRDHFGESARDYLVQQFKFIGENPFGEIKFSQNKEFFAISFNHIERNGGNYHFEVFNKNFDFRYNFTHPIEDKYSDSEGFEIRDTGGEIYFLQKNYLNESRKAEKNDKVNYSYEIFRYDNLGLTKFKIENSNNFITHPSLVFLSNELGLVGFYSNKGVDYLDGVCFFKIDLENSTLLKESYMPLSNQFFTDKHQNGKEERLKRIRNPEIRDLFVDRDDNITLSAEEFTIEDTALSNDMNIYERSHMTFTKMKNKHHFDDIISIKMNTDGSLIWSRSVDKKQIGIKKSSFATAHGNNKTCYFINGTAKEMRGERIQFRQTGLSKSNLYLITVNDKEIRYQKLINEEKSKIWYDVMKGSNIQKENTIILQGVKGREKQVIKVSL